MTSARLSIRREMAEYAADEEEVDLKQPSYRDEAAAAVH